MVMLVNTRITRPAAPPPRACGLRASCFRACGCRPYISDGWNIFDIIVVSLSLVALGPIEMPINVLRCG